MTSYDSSFIQTLPGLLLVKNLDSVFLNMTTHIAKLIGWNSVEKSLGKTDFDVPCKASEFAPQYIKLDKEVIKSGKDLLTVESQNFAEGWRANLVKRHILYDHNKVASGIFTHMMDITNTSFHRNFFILGTLNHKYINTKAAIYTISNECQNSFELSQRQEECLFFLIRGKTAKQIAAILNLSPRTVEGYIENIKIKLDCFSKYQLIEKVINSDFFYYIPKSLASQNMQELLC